MSRDPLWMEGDDFSNDMYSEPSDSFDELDAMDDDDDDDDVDPDRLHDGFYED